MSFTNLVDLFENSVSSYGDRPVFGTKADGEYSWITYKELGQMVDRCRAGLASLGVGQDSRVALISDNRIEWAVTAYATYGLGAQIVPMYEKQLPRTWRFIIEDAGAKVVIAGREAVDKAVRPWLADIPHLVHVVNLDAPADNPFSFQDLMARGTMSGVGAQHPSEDQLAGMIYTSGTTGDPKGVALTHGNFCSNITAILECFPIIPEDRSLTFLPWAHSFGQTCELHSMIASGASMGLVESVETIIANLSDVRPTMLIAVPRIFNKIYTGLLVKMEREGGLAKKLFDTGISNAEKMRKLAAEGKKGGLLSTIEHKVIDKLVFSKVRARLGGNLKYAFSGGAALSKEVAQFIDDIGIVVYEGYGLSETSPVATTNRPGEQRIGSVGRPLPGVRIDICKVSSIQEEGVGEVVIYGPNVMQGYNNLPELTAETLNSSGGLKTGDLGRIDEDGYLWITGRIKEQYKLTNGKYVVPGPMEEVLKLSPWINQIMIYGDNRPNNTALIVPEAAFVAEWAAKKGKPQRLDQVIDDPELKAVIREQIDIFSRDARGYERVKEFRLLPEEFSTDNDMMTPKMSLKRNNIMRRYKNMIDSMYE